MTHFLITPLLTAFYQLDYVTNRISYLLFFAIGLMTAKISKHSWIAAILLAYVIGTYLYVIFLPNQYYDHLGRINFAMVAKSARSLLMVIGSLSIASLMSNETIEKMKEYIGIVLPVLLGVQIFSFHYTNVSVAMTTFSLCVAFSPKFRMLNILLLTIYFYVCNAIIGFFSLLAGLILYKLWQKKFAYLLIVVPLVAIYFIKPETYFLNGRLQVWTNCIETFREIKSYAIGAGGGTLQHFVPLYEMINNKQFHGVYTAWAHNDFIQILFEHGIIGLGLFFAFIISLMRKIEKVDLLFLFVFLINMGGNFPLSMPSDMLLFFIYCKYHLTNKREKCLN